MKSGRLIAYESAIMALWGFLFVNVLTVFAFCGVRDIGIFREGDGYWLKWSKGGLTLLAGTIFLWFVFPKKSIVNLDYPEDIKQASRFVSIVYGLVSMVLLFVA